MTPDKKKNKFDFESEEEHQKYIQKVIGFFQTERSEEIGVLAAEQVLNFFLETVGDEIYKKSLADTKALIKEKFDDLEIELDMLSSE